MVAVGVVGGDPAKLDRHMIATEAGPVLHVELTHPDAVAVQIDAPNDHAADVLVANWVNNSGQQVRTGYLNEKGELRSRPGSPATVPSRIQQRDGAQTGDLQQWTDAGNTPLSRIDAQGFAALRVGEWTDLILADGIEHGTVRAQVRLESAYGVVRMRGIINGLDGFAFSAGATLATVPAGYEPTVEVSQIARQGTAGVTLTVTTGGALSTSSSIGSGPGPEIRLDGFSWEAA
ncbi:hypothetical protein [Glycomyces tarimensis]